MVAIDQCRMLRNGFGEHTDYSDDDYRIVRGSGWPLALINVSRLSGHLRSSIEYHDSLQYHGCKLTS